MLVIGATAGFWLQGRALEAVGTWHHCLAIATIVSLIHDRMQQNGDAADPLADPLRRSPIVAVT